MIMLNQCTAALHALRCMCIPTEHWQRLPRYWQYSECCDSYCPAQSLPTPLLILSTICPAGKRRCHAPHTYPHYSSDDQPPPRTRPTRLPRCHCILVATASFHPPPPPACVPTSDSGTYLVPGTTRAYPCDLLAEPGRAMRPEAASSSLAYQLAACTCGTSTLLALSNRLIMHAPGLPKRIPMHGDRCRRWAGRQAAMVWGCEVQCCHGRCGRVGWQHTLRQGAGAGIDAMRRCGRWVHHWWRAPQPLSSQSIALGVYCTSTCHLSTVVPRSRAADEQHGRPQHPPQHPQS